MNQGAPTFTPNSNFSASSSQNQLRGTITLQGVAATSTTAMSYAEISLIDSRYNEETTEADIDGNFTMSIDLSRFQPPYGLRAKDSFGDVITSVLVTPPSSGSTQIVNINPITMAVVAGAIASGNPDDVFKPQALAAIQQSDLENSQSALRAVFQNLISDAGLASNVDLVSSPFVKNHQYLDKVLGELEFTQPGSSFQITNLLDPLGSGQFVTVSRSAVLNGALASNIFNL